MPILKTCTRVFNMKNKFENKFVLKKIFFENKFVVKIQGGPNTIGFGTYLRNQFFKVLTIEVKKFNFSSNLFGNKLHKLPL